MMVKSALKFKFKSLPHQKHALKNISGVFRGVKFKPSKYPQSNPYLDLNIYNSLISKNIQAIRHRNKIEKGQVEINDKQALNLDVWMETGTGKTFTFLETIYKLNHIYGLAKFIILVPSNAIRQGTIKSIEVTREFFYRRYSQKHIEAFDYSPQKIMSFNNNSNKNISVLVMTYQSFNKERNTINQKNLEDSLFKKQSAMEEISELRPVIIIDEPHRFTGEQTQKFLPKFKPQIILRFGATFRYDHKNLIHVLDSAAAFKQSLVKTITVKGFRNTGLSEHSLVYRGYKGKDRQAIIDYNPSSKSNKRLELAVGGNIGEALSIDALDSCIIDKITKGELLFTNDNSLTLGNTQDYSGLEKVNTQAMIEETIATHFKREEQLFKKNIKALSLIFIDSVKRYMLEDGSPGELAKIFEKSYKNKLTKVLKKKDLDSKYRKYLERTKENISQVHNGYFAISKKIKDQEDKINLILRDKERLLTHKEDLRFIFSMWALQEGWDNPNIFTLCKLAPSNSNITKLQQIGRGLRLAVKQTPGGFERLTHEDISSSEFNYINELQVIVPGEEKSFVTGIQREISKNTIQSKTNIINVKVLFDHNICENLLGEDQAKWNAFRLLQVLSKHNLIDLDNESGEGKILTSLGMDKAISEAKEDKIIFSEDRLIDLFDKHLDLDTVVKTASSLSDTDVEINTKLWPKFKILWEDINRNSTYDFSINEKELHRDIIAEINEKLKIDPISFVVDKTTRAEFKETAEESSYLIENNAAYSFFSFHEFVKRIADETKLSFHSIVNILKQINDDKFNMLSNDESMAIENITEICFRQIRHQILKTLTFSIHGLKQGGTSLTDDQKNILKSIKLTSMGKNQHIIKNQVVKNKSLTRDLIGKDSDFEGQVIEQSRLDEIDVFAKIPEVRIPIPGGKIYNPDFAYVVSKQLDGAEKVTHHLVLETKGYKNEDSLRGTEKFKIEVAKKFFNALDKRIDKDEIRIAYKTLYNENDSLEGTIGGLFKNDPLQD